MDDNEQIEDSDDGIRPKLKRSKLYDSDEGDDVSEVKAQEVMKPQRKRLGKVKQVESDGDVEMVSQDKEAESAKEN